MQKYTKAIIAFFAVLLPFLDQIGAALPGFLTLAWVQGLVLALTPVAVYFFPNKDPRQPVPTAAVRSPVFIGFLAGLVALLMLSSCGIQRPQVHSISDAIAVTAADVETAAQTVKQMCRNIRAGGPCASDALISTAAKERLKLNLESVLVSLRAADMALAVNDGIEAEGQLARSQMLMTMLRAELSRLSN